MPIDCTPDALAAEAKCFKCLPIETLLQIQTSLLCQIVNNGGGGGTPVFGPQGANLVFAGPASGAAAAPAFRALVTDDLGTTMTPQFLRVGIGTPPDATMALTCLIPGAAGDQEVARFNATVGDPFITVGTTALGAIVSYQVATNQILLGVHGVANHVLIDGGGNLIAGGTIETANVFRAVGSSGINTTINATSSVTVVGGIVTVNAQPTQVANTVFSGPAAAGPSVPTFRALVAADIPSLSAVYVPVARTITIAGTVNQVVSSAGAQDLSANRTWTLSLPQSIATTSTPQFARMGLGQAADASLALKCLIAGGGAGVDSEVARFDCTTGDPYVTFGALAVDNGGLIEYKRSANKWRIGIHGAPVVEIDNTALLDAAGGFAVGGVPGVSGTITAVNTVTVVNGIVTVIV